LLINYPILFSILLFDRLLVHNVVVAKQRFESEGFGAVFKGALVNVLSSDVGLFVFQQIVGLGVSSVATIAFKWLLKFKTLCVTTVTCVKL
jgi:hypothetical protein